MKDKNVKQSRNSKYSSNKRGSADSRGRKETEAESYKASRSETRNDISWYVADPQILVDVASIPFSDALSDFTREVRYEAQAFSALNTAYVTPGIMTFHMHPTYGFGTISGTPLPDAATDPLNIAAKSIYSFVRKHNSGSANYDEVDLMQYIISMDNVYAIWCWAVRLYGIARTYNYKNRYTPEALMGQMGLTSGQQKTLIQHLASFRAMLNTYAIRMSSLAVPTVMPIVQRHFWLYSNIFQDCEDSKSQYYMYNPASYYVYDEINGKCLRRDFETAIRAGGNNIVAVIRSILDNMLDPLLYSQSIGIMSGDILKAYEGNIFTFSTVSEDFVTVPVYNEKVLTQIHHIHTSRWIPNDIEQANNILYTPYIATTNAYDNTTVGDTVISSDMFINLPYNAPNPEDVMYATRLMNTTDLTEVVVGSEVVEFITISDDTADGTNWLFRGAGTGHLSTDIVIDATDPDVTNDLWRNLVFNSYVQMFDWAPRFNLAHSTNGTALDEVYFVGDLANYTIISPATLKNIHSAAFCGLYGIPYTLTRA